MSMGYGWFRGNRKQWEDISMVTEKYLSCMIMIIVMSLFFQETCEQKVNIKLSIDYSLPTSDNTSIVAFTNQGAPTKP